MPSSERAAHVSPEWVETSVVFFITINCKPRGLNHLTLWPVMDLPDVISYILSKPGAQETLPFGPDTLVYKVGGKMFALTSPDEFPARLNLKCDPERALDLRDAHESIIPGWHMNKRHWNTLILDGSLPARLVCELIDHSYDLVVASLPRSQYPQVLKGEAGKPSLL